MIPFQPADLTAMRATQEAHMSHVARVLRWSPTQDPESGQPVDDWSDEGTTPCGVQFTPQGAILEGTMGTVVANYRVRLPLALLPITGPMNRYEITRAFGEALAPTWLLEQVGPVAPGPSGLVALARMVTN